MPFNYQLLQRLNLEKTDWVMVKYRGFDAYASGQIATNQSWGAEEFPIFDEDKLHLYVHFTKQQHPSKLQIERIEYFYFGKNHPDYFHQFGQIQYSFGKFHQLSPGFYTLLKTNGDTETIRFVENKIELEAGRIECNLYYFDKDGKLQKLAYWHVIDIYS